MSLSEPSRQFTDQAVAYCDDCCHEQRGRWLPPFDRPGCGGFECSVCGYVSGGAA